MNYRNKIPRSNGGFYLFAINYFLGFLMFACASVCIRGSPTFWTLITITNSLSCAVMLSCRMQLVNSPASIIHSIDKVILLMIFPCTHYTHIFLYGCKSRTRLLNSIILLMFFLFIHCLILSYSLNMFLILLNFFFSKICIFSKISFIVINVLYTSHQGWNFRNILFEICLCLYTLTSSGIYFRVPLTSSSIVSSFPPQKCIAASKSPIIT